MNPRRLSDDQLWVRYERAGTAEEQDQLQREIERRAREPRMYMVRGDPMGLFGIEDEVAA